MSPETDPSTQDESPTAAGEEEEPAEAEAPTKKGAGSGAPPARNPLSRDTDFIERPGFRSASNSRSKVQKKKKKR